MISSSKILKSTESFKSRNFVFALIDNFSLLSFAGAVDALRIANRVAPHSYTWSITSETGNAVSCSANINYNVDNSFLELGRDDTIILCGGVDIQVATTKRLLNWLRREARKGVKMVALCTASYSLAKAGLLNGKKATIHWENQDSFSEEFEEIELTKTVFVVDGNRMTSAGGT
ncbi:MAG: AraC family transcriptional regulator, partial [Rhodobacteraceae bacterium]|nr:AraC family transcriptional regulator [Paracoccaceae bacterium]